MLDPRNQRGAGLLLEGLDAELQAGGGHGHWPGWGGTGAWARGYGRVVEAAEVLLRAAAGRVTLRRLPEAAR